MTEPAPNTFSSRRAWKHVGLVALLVVAVGAASSPWVKDPGRFGEGVGRLLLVLCGASFFLSYLWQTGRRRRAVGLGVLLVASLVALTVALVGRGRAAAGETLTAADMAPLVKADQRLKHPSLAFSFELPATESIEFTAEARRALAMSFPGRSDVTGWAWRATNDDATLVMLIKDHLNTKDALEGIARGFKNAMDQSAELKLIEEDSVWNDHERSVLLVLGLGPRGVMVVRFVAGPAFAVGIMASGEEVSDTKARAMTLSL